MAADPKVTDEWWTAEDCASWLGITAAAWRNYASHGVPKGNPAPVADRRFGRTNVWRPVRVIEWNAKRPGSGNWKHQGWRKQDATQDPR